MMSRTEHFKKNNLEPIITYTAIVAGNSSDIHTKFRQQQKSYRITISFLILCT